MRDFHHPGRSTVLAANGMCATSHPLAAKVAVQMLESGGNAVDAALAGAALLGICEPQMTGIGGDCFALIAEPGQDVVALNGSGRAPAGLSAQAMRAAGHAVVPAAGHRGGDDPRRHRRLLRAVGQVRRAVSGRGPRPRDPLCR